MLAPWKKSYAKPRQHIKKQRHFFTKVHIVKAMVFPVVMYGFELGYKESWAPKNWCFWTAVLEKTLESPLDSKEIQLVNPKGNQSWIFIGRTDAEAKTPILWSPHAKSWLSGKDPDAGKDWGQKGTTEDEMARWHHQLDGHDFEQAPGVGDGQGSLACWSPWGCRVGHFWATKLNWKCTMVQRNLVGYGPWGHKESDMTEQFHFHFSV